uniref:Uncharacterized protein n=1 Tax=Acrobeloides nanus TaxID=290746 RepID=A0A914DHT1_9BILA
GEARIDKPQAISVLKESPWFQIPYPGQFGMIRVSLGLFLGMFMSALASKVESLGDYAILAKVANEKSPPISTINRALTMEGPS